MMEKLRETANRMPANPGVYLFLDSQGEILYVGKAGNLRKRVVSYFTGARSGKTDLLLRKSSDINHTVVTSESEALLLENNLIKKHQPRYNILLKDDKTFPWICIRNEPFPRIFSTRTLVNDGSEYFGPYTSGFMVKTMLSLVHQLYSLRNCSLNLNARNIEAGKYKVCLEYQMGNCKGPCEGLQSSEDYDSAVSQIRQILRGNIRTVTDYLKKQMAEYASELRFEEAQKVKERLETISHYQVRSVVVNPVIGNADVFGYSQEGDYAAVNFMRVVEGAVVQTFTIGFKRRMEEDSQTLLDLGIGEVVHRVGELTRNVIVPFHPGVSFPDTRFSIPVRGDKKKLLEMAERNAIYFRIEQKKRLAGKTIADRTGKNLERLKNDLHMSKIPRHIECFDNSNIQGTNPVAACVVFRNGKPARSEYRHYNIKEVTGPDDYASMEEVVFRRYRRLLEEKKDLPDLVVIDGGKGQLSSAIQSLARLGIQDRVAVIGIAKRLEEIYFPGDSVPLYIDKNSVSLKIIQQIRNEAHRFGINLHRLKRSKEMLRSDFDNIKGIGPGTVKVLLSEFRSPEIVAGKTEEELSQIIGRAKAKLISDYFRGQDVSRETL
jgi:excinuclease ABC subunit C